MNFLNKNTWRNLALAIFGATTLAACGGAGSCANCVTPTPNANLALTFTAPAAYPAGIATDVPVMVTNTSNVTASNLIYSIDATTNTTGGTITISAASQAACANLAAQQSCQLVAQVAANPVSHPGSFSVVATSSSTQSTLNKVANFFKLNTTTTNLADASVGLVALPTNTQTGANGITLYYPTTALAESGINGTNIMVTAIVTSANAGGFNTINLVDGNGKLLNFTVLTGNSGNDMSNLPVGSIVTFWVNIPQSSSQLQFQAQTATTTGGTSTPVGDPSTSTNSNTVTLAASTASAGILNILPNYFSLTTNYESQIITLTNTGNGELSAIAINPSAPLITLSNNCAATLAAGATCQYTVGFDKTQPIAGTSLVTVNYTSAGTPSSSTATVNYTGRVAVAGLTISSGTNPNFDFTSRTAAGSQSMTSQVTLTNTGSDTETLSSFSPPTYFSLNTTGVTGTACTTGMELTKGASCNINLVYTNPTATPSATTAVTVNYNYTVLGEVKTASSSVGLTYQTLQSLASLTVSPATISFATPVLNNAFDSSLQTITISNNSDTNATSVVETLSGTNSGLFNIVTKTSDCTATLAAGDSCTLKIQFGPFASSTGAGTKTASMDLSYNNAATIVPNNTPITAQAVSAQSAVITNALTANNGFSGGDGTSVGTQFTVDQSASAPTVTLTISNTGSVPATSFFITPSALGNWTLTNNNCGTSGAEVTLNATSGTCSFKLQLATTTTGAQNYNLSNIAMDWVDQDNPTGQTQQMSGTIYATVASTTPVESANISVSAVPLSWDNSETGGASTDPLLLQYKQGYTTPASITLTYANNGLGAANGFTTSYSPLPTSWSIQTNEFDYNDCANLSSLRSNKLDANTSCTVKYKFFLPTGPGELYATGTEFNNGNIKVSWSDNTTHTNQVLTLPAGTAGTGGYNTNNVIYNAPYLDLFVSASTHDGQFSTTAGGNDAIAQADALCMNDANKPDSVGLVYKALLVANESVNQTTTNSRYACTTADCTGGGNQQYNWVLESNMRYASPLGGLNVQVFKTNAVKIAVTPLIASIGTDSTIRPWTGLANSTTIGSSEAGYYNWMSYYPGFASLVAPTYTSWQVRGNCNNWRSNATHIPNTNDYLSVGAGGQVTKTTMDAFSRQNTDCDKLQPLYCVQQPQLTTP